MGQVFGAAPEFRPCGFFATAAAALRAINGLPARLAVVEMVLPDACGIQCAMELRARRPDLKTILTTTLRDLPLLKRAFDAGISEYLSKPLGPGQCLTALGWVSCRLGGTWRSAGPPEAASGTATADRSAAGAAESLTTREVQVLTFLAKGYLYKEIEGALHLSHTALRKAQQSLYRKLHVHTRADAVRRGQELGLC